MDELVIGFNFFGGHDTSLFAIFEDDFYALSQERVTRIKHDAIFPIDAIYEMIRYKNIDPSEVKKLHIGVATKAFEKRVFNQNSYEMSKLLREILKGKEENLYIKEFVRKKEELKNSKLKKINYLLFNKNGMKYLFYQAFGQKKELNELIREHLEKIFINAKIDITFYEHHLSHAYGAYYSSRFKKSLILTIDGEGDGSFSKLFFVENGDFKQIAESKNVFVKNMQKYEFADNGYASLGNIYSIFTYLLGFTPNADEGKVEALAAFGDAKNHLFDDLLKSITVEKESLSLKIKPQVLDKIFDKNYLEKIFKELKKEDIAASVQKFCEEVILSYLKEIKKSQKCQNLILSGGVSANVILNMKIYENFFENIFITPAMGDEGIAQGAAAIKYLFLNEDKKESLFFPFMPYLGSSYTNEEILEALGEENLKYELLDQKAYIKAAQMIVDGKIGAIFQGRAEFGPRALGNRSIIADVRDKEIQKHINQNIKKRPLFQPFCPSILEEEKNRLFQKCYDNKHMTIAFKLKDEFKDEIPGAVHIDLSARVQFVQKDDNPNYYALINEVKKLTGFGVIINTSFNKHGRTMVLTPKDAVRDFLDTNLDFMVIDGIFVQR